LEQAPHYKFIFATKVKILNKMSKDIAISIFLSKIPANNG